MLTKLSWYKVFPKAVLVQGVSKAVSVQGVSKDVLVQGVSKAEKAVLAWYKVFLKHS